MEEHQKAGIEAECVKSTGREAQDVPAQFLQNDAKEHKYLKRRRVLVASTKEAEHLETICTDEKHFHGRDLSQHS